MESEVVVMVLSEILRKNDDVRQIRPPAVAGSFYPADCTALKQLIDQQLDYGRKLLQQLETVLPTGVPKAVIVPHAGYVYSGTAAALAYALLERGWGSVTRAVIVGPTHRVAVRGIACPTATAFATPLGEVLVDVDAERKALGLAADEPLRSGTHARPGAPAPAMIVNDPTHAQEHAVEVQIPFLQTVLGPARLLRRHGRRQYRPQRLHRRFLLESDRHAFGRRARDHRLCGQRGTYPQKANTCG